MANPWAMVKMYAESEKPEGFLCTARFVTCFIKKENKLLFLKKEDRLALLWGEIESCDLVIAHSVRRILYSNMGVYINKPEVFDYRGLFFLEGEMTFSYYIFTLAVENQNFNPTKSEYDFLSPNEVDVGKLNEYERVIFEKHYINK